jgi:hypothetical protein
VELFFHPDFNIKTAGDVILRADDKHAHCFFFPLSTLQFLSSFFRNLPPPSETDLVGDFPLIPMLDAPSRGLHLFLLALQSIEHPTPFTYPGHRDGDIAICEAAVFGRRFDVPLISRLLLETRTSSAFQEPFIIFAIWAIAGIEPSIQSAAEATCGTHAIPITHVNQDIVRIIKRHAIASWSQLQDLHLRRSVGLAFFKQHFAFQELEAGRPCISCNEDGEAVTAAAHDRIGKAETIPQILALWDDKYEMDCPHCTCAVSNLYIPLMTWFQQYTTEWEYVKPYAEWMEESIHFSYRR